MPTYAIGDVHGCTRTLRRLLDALPFDEARDRLWLVGDLVGHGPDPVGVLRLVCDVGSRLGPRSTVVLGNHDLRLLAALDGVTVPAKVLDTLRDVLAAPDGSDLVEWLSQRPLLHAEDEWVLVHAGLLPKWSVAEAAERAIEARAILTSGCRADLLRSLYAEGDRGKGSPELERGVETTRVMTTIRTVAADDSLCDHKGSPETAPPGCRPWFAHPARAHRDETLVFGHWASLGLRVGEGWVALDSGCAWGGPLSAVRLEDRRVFQAPRVD